MRTARALAARDEEYPVKHVRCISVVPGSAQADVSLAAVFELIANILAAVGQAVLTKESQEFPPIPTPTE